MSEISVVWTYIEASNSSQAAAENQCPATTPELSNSVDPEDVMRWAQTVCTMFDPVNAATALCIMSYESGGLPDQKNHDDPARGSIGLMQINSDWWIGSEYHEQMVRWFGRDDDTYLDPVVNIASAALLVNDPTLEGWHSWASSRLCPHEHHDHTQH